MTTTARNKATAIGACTHRSRPARAPPGRPASALGALPGLTGNCRCAAVTVAGMAQQELRRERPARPARACPGGCSRRRPSKLATFADCPRRYRFAYVDRPDPAEGAAVGAQHGRLRGARRAALLVGPAARTPHPGCAHGSSCTRAGRRTGSAMPSRPSAGAPRAAGWLTDYVAGLDPADEPRRHRAHRRRDHRAAGALRADRPDRPARRRAGGRRLQDRPARSAPTTRPAAHPRWPPTCSASGARCAVPAAGWSCTTCPRGTVAAFEHTERSLANHVRRAEDIAARHHHRDRGAGRGSRPRRRVPGRARPPVQLVRLPAQLPDRVRPPLPARETWSFLADDDDPA